MLKQVLVRNLWHENVAAVQLLGLCPLLAVSTSVDVAAALSVASAFVLIGSMMLISLVRKSIPHDVRLPMYVLIIATFTSIAVLLMEAFAMTLYMRIALFVQIIVTNCMILGRVNLVASKEKVSVAFVDAVTTALGFSAVLLALGAIREFSAPAIPIVAYPAGAFITLGLLLGLQQFISKKVMSAKTAEQTQQSA